MSTCPRSLQGLSNVEIFHKGLVAGTDNHRCLSSHTSLSDHLGLSECRTEETRGLVDESVSTDGKGTVRTDNQHTHSISIDKATDLNSRDASYADRNRIPTYETLPPDFTQPSKRRSYSQYQSQPELDRQQILLHIACHAIRPDVCLAAAAAKSV
jgi:hypothetical protein